MSALLTSVTLENVRRFGLRTELRFEKGATLIVAPNGIGKSSIFEALELALSGGVNRLAGANLDPLIRDGEEEASIRIEFDDTSYSQVQISRNSPAAITNSLNNIFGTDIPHDSLPFLLRLTHLMDQRDSDWPTRAQSRDAGDYLGRLPIGREASRARNNLTRDRLSATKRLTAARNNESTAKSELEQWEALTNELDELSDLEDSELKSLEELFIKLYPVAENYGLEEPSPELNSLRQVSAGCLAQLDRELDLVNRRMASLLTLESSVTLYIEAIASASELQLSSEAQEEALQSLDTTLAEIASRLQKFRAGVGPLALQHQGIRDLKSRHETIRLVNESLTALRASEKELEMKEGLHQARLSAQASTQQRLIHVKQEHDSIRQQLQANEHHSAELNISLELSAAWNSREQALKAISDQVALVSKELAEFEQAREDSSAALSSAQSELNEARVSLSAIQRATTALKQAVSQIAEHLSPGIGTCPVCASEFEPPELVRRLGASLEEIHPDLVAMTELVRRREATVISLREKNEQDKHTTSERRLNLDSLVDSRGRLTAERDSYQERAALYGRTPQESTVELEARMLKALEERAALVVAKNALDEEASDAVLSKVRVELENEALALANSKSERARIVQELSSQMSNRDSLLQNLQPLPDNLGELESNLAREIDEYNRLTLQDGVQLEGAKESRKDLEDSLGRSKKKLAKLKRTINSALVEWKSLGLAGNPDSEARVTAVDSAENSKERLESDLATIEQIRVNLAKWDRSILRDRAQARVDQFRGDQTPEETTDRLTSSLSKASLEVCGLSDVHSAINTLVDKLDAALANVNSMVESVNPLWASLLKRVVVNPLFNGTKLAMSQTHQKFHAEATVPIGSSRFRIDQIASQAQSTDLQLTFLLAMAVNRPWCKWKGLLLDDPTQHHDLVHASSVFDLLRDYITEYDFQVILATHDALQARFFTRKLINDGIPVKLWHLRPGIGGITAELE